MGEDEEYFEWPHWSEDERHDVETRVPDQVDFRLDTRSGDYIAFAKVAAPVIAAIGAVIYSRIQKVRRQNRRVEENLEEDITIEYPDGRRVHKHVSVGKRTTDLTEEAVIVQVGHELEAEEPVVDEAITIQKGNALPHPPDDDTPVSEADA